ncbi:MAG: nitronate monooxygenase, partial [Pseudomonadota bacterium]
YPIQNNLTQAMRAEAARTGDLDAMTAWAGQSARLARAAPAAEIVKTLWADAKRLLA